MDLGRGVELAFSNECGFPRYLHEEELNYFTNGVRAAYAIHNGAPAPSERAA